MYNIYSVTADSAVLFYVVGTCVPYNSTLTTVYCAPDLNPFCYFKIGVKILTKLCD